MSILRKLNLESAVGNQEPNQSISKNLKTVQELIASGISGNGSKGTGLRLGG